MYSMLSGRLKNDSGSAIASAGPIMVRDTISSWIAEVITKAIITVAAAAIVAIVKYAYKSAARRLRKRKKR